MLHILNLNVYHSFNVRPRTQICSSQPGRPPPCLSINPPKRTHTETNSYRFLPSHSPHLPPFRPQTPNETFRTYPSFSFIMYTIYISMCGNPFFTPPLIYIETFILVVIIMITKIKYTFLEFYFHFFCCCFFF